jgi:hypothetical protein
MATLSLYNHTAKILFDSSSTDAYKVILLSAGTFSATHTTLAQAAVSYTELSTGNGYTAGGQNLANVAITVQTTNDAKFDADDAIWSATGAGITAVAAILFNDTLASDPPLAYINFGGSETANASTDFKIVWSASGIFTWTVA